MLWHRYLALTYEWLHFGLDSRRNRLAPQSSHTIHSLFPQACAVGILPEVAAPRSWTGPDLGNDRFLGFRPNLPELVRSLELESPHAIEETFDSTRSMKDNEKLEFGRICIS